MIPADLDRTDGMNSQASGWLFNGSMGMSTAENDAKHLKRTRNVDLM